MRFSPGQESSIVEEIVEQRVIEMSDEKASSLKDNDRERIQ